MIKFQLAILFAFFFFQSFSNELVRYYYGEINLTHSEIDLLCEEIIQKRPSNFLLSLAYYQKGVLASGVDDSFQKYEYYDKALDYLKDSKEPDDYLFSVILKNQGVLLKDYGLTQFAIQKYEEAIPYAFKFGVPWELHVKYNLACAYEKQDREQALRLFFEIIDKAKSERQRDRVAKCFLEISKMFNHSLEHEQALALMDSALVYAKSDWLKARIYHNRAHTKYLMQDYESQKNWLFMSLYLREGSERFISLMDLGESWLIDGISEEATPLLIEAMGYYEDQRLHPDNIKIFRWMHQIYPDSVEITDRHIIELEKYIEIKEKLEFLLKQQAMLQLYLRLEEKKESRKIIGLWQSLALIGAAMAIIIYLTWRIWWYRLRKRLATKIIALGKRWENRSRDH